MSNVPAKLWDRPRISDEERKNELKKEVLRLTLPSEQNAYGHKRYEIARLVNRSETTVWNIQHELVNDGSLEMTESGRIVHKQPTEEIILKSHLTREGFEKIASIRKWIMVMKKKDIKNIDKQVRYFWQVCQTLNVHADAFLQPIEEIEELHDKFIELFKNNKVVYVRKHFKNPKNKNHSYDHYTNAVKSFVRRNGIQIPAGNLEMKRKPEKIYSSIHLNDAQRKIAIKFMADIGDIWKTIFVIHHELGLRADTLLKLKPTFERRTTTIDGVSCEYYLANIYEPKQQKTYPKLIMTQEAREVVSKLQSGQAIHDMENIKNLNAEYNQHLRELYVHLGWISSDLETQENYEVGTKEWYLVNDATHAIRHSCVHWLMRASGERKEVVASMFWEKPQTLEYYAKTSIDSILQQGICMICNKPNDIDPSYERFCTIRHALLYYCGGKK